MLLARPVATDRLAGAQEERSSMDVHVQIAGRSSPAARRRQTLTAIAVLSFCCVLWGYSFPVMQLAAAAWDEAARPVATVSLVRLEPALRATFLGWRFTLAAAFFWLVTFRGHGRYTRADWTAGIVVGAFFGAGVFLQIMGLAFTLPSVSGFLTALPVVFAPLGQAWLMRRPVGLSVWVAAAVALTGIALLSHTGTAAEAVNTVARRPPVPYLGEALTIASAVLFTGQIMSLDRLGPRAQALHLTCIMLATAGLINLAGGCAIAGAEIYRPAMLRALASAPTVWWALPTLIVFSTVVAMHLMNVYQPRVSPAAASVVYCLEPVMATLFSLAMGTETLTVMTVAGGAAILAAVLIVTRR